jgi:predicted dehydrogenase/threonine dehydrogenase-like Zn-dependent dehydrogenase
MLALLADIESGEVGTYQVPEPELRAGGVLIRTAFSAISSGTERNTIEIGRKSLLGKAFARPDLVKQVLEFTRTNGVRAAYQKVQSRLESVTCLGYSCSGTVLAVAEGVPGLQAGDRVACAGVGHASHSEINFVPRNLVAKVPAVVSLEAASLATIGAIAVQGMRRAELSFGENVVVIGAGLLGVLTIQLARAAGCRVIAVDVNSTRALKSLEFGASLGLATSDPALPSVVAEFTKYGADAAIVTASSTSTEPVELAAKVLRDRGRIAVLGAVPLGVSREVMYRKELSLVLSRSYGPGRYDPNYEDHGNDYPIGYVRWTEQRNMESFLESLASKAVNVSPLLQLQYEIGQGAQAYSEIEQSGAYTAILTYGVAESATQVASSLTTQRDGRIEVLRIGCLGAGSFARSVLFPELRAINGVRLEAVATASGISAFSAQKSFRFNRTQTPGEMLDSPDIDAFFVLSHHDSHAHYVVSAVEKQKPVFAEKPLAVRREELESICVAFRKEKAQGKSPFLMVGFNRRFAPATGQVCEFFAGRREPMLVHVRVNAGYLPPDHWAQQAANGGRIVGEACHFLDWMRFVVDRSIVGIYATALPDGARYNRDNAAIVVSFADGSVGNLLYTANGDMSLAKEHYEVFCGGAVARIGDYQTLELMRAGKSKRVKLSRDKGHRKELELTVSAITRGQPAPIPFEQLVEVTEATFAVIDSLNCGLPVKLREYDAADAAADELNALRSVRENRRT